jgi:hypothetical protein
MIVLKVAILGVRFLLELCLLAALGYWGFHSGGNIFADLALGLGAPTLAAIVWGTYVAPKARVRLSAPRQLACEIAVFAVGIAALASTGQVRLAVLFAVAAIVSRALVSAWGREAITYNPATSG